MERTPVLVSQAREEWIEARPALVKKVQSKAGATLEKTFGRSYNPWPTTDAPAASAPM